MKKRLNKLGTGKSGIVHAIEGESAGRCRIAVMGVVPGTEVTVERKGVFGDPLIGSLRGYKVALRASEAAMVVLE